LDERAEGPAARSIITALLKPEPSERLGVKEGSTRVILDHLFFKGLSVDLLQKGLITPMYVPEPPSYHEPVSKLMAVKPYNGDQSIFAEF
jgi:hypothetical protein